MYYVWDDENIAAEIKQLIFKRAGKPSESVLGRLLLCTGIYRDCRWQVLQKEKHCL